MPRSKRLFRDLVSLQVPEEQVLNAALRERLAVLPIHARAPPPKVRDLDWNPLPCSLPSFAAGSPLSKCNLALDSNSNRSHLGQDQT